MFTHPWSKLMLAGTSWLSACAVAQVDQVPSAPQSSDAESAGKGGPSDGGASASAAAGKPSGNAGSPAKGGAGAATPGGATAGGGGSAGAFGTGVGGASGGSAGSPGSEPANTNLPFTEDFEDGEANGFLPWNADLTAGAWVVVADAAGMVYEPIAPVTDLEFAVGGSTSWTDVTLTLKVRLADASSGAQILLRMKEPKTYLVVEMAVGKYKLRGRADGSTKDLVAPSPKPLIAAGTWYTVGVSAKGSAVTLTLDDVVIGNAVAQAAISNGGIAVGVDEGSAAFDDIRVVSLP